MRARQNFGIPESVRLDRPGRALLRVLCLTAVLLAGVCCRETEPPAPGGAGTAATPPPLADADLAFLDELQCRSFRFFWDETDPATGLTPDRALADGGPSKANGGRPVISIASIGFALTAYCIAEQRGWVTRREAYDRTLVTLRTLRDRCQRVHGFFYHFLDPRTAQRTWDCELSSIDTALLMCGVLTARQHFAGTEVEGIASELFDAVEWRWMLAGGKTLSMGWRPESGFIDSRWDEFNEGWLIYILGMGSGTHALPAESWHAWRRSPVITYAAMTYMQCPPLFTHQYPQAWLDVRQMRDDYADYFRNSTLATLAHRQFCMDLRGRFPEYGPDMWGITASDSAKGYVAWGGPPAEGGAAVDPAIDGTVVPCAAGGSIPFTPKECLSALREMRRRFGDRIYRKYGFVDAFNPHTGWVNPDVIGIDVGITLVMAENARSGFVWKTFMRNPEVQRGLKLAGFRPADALPPNTSMYALAGR